ncbi:Sas10/Utp3/C1D family isoform 1 [Tripterygium wilfordii]|uniref:Sas10/Utp3/C1D family isoform 1 n=1 Tax=Tripterygium wilfordii TaxID=458696 RepID=A0A7J7DZS7_TRIWF|nr:neuroguidin [Tripterygium wilfordii]XP_038719253.1 neuroguidin [Tripterygium wilfordii]KAF5751586.1 Sas10/Utp3/C1D family isoform 1 [Tripterygium wilfordii]
MDDSADSKYKETIKKEAPQLAALLKEMKLGLDTVTCKVQALTVKVKAGNYPTADGISYLEAKHLLLISYCQSLVYYLLCKAEGLSIEGHPVVRSLVQIRLFLEKIRPIDKKLQYQIQKLTRGASGVTEQVGQSEKISDAPQKADDDLLKYRPNPDMLINKSDMTTQDGAGIYRPPKFAPISMDEDKMSRQERNALRREKESLRRAKDSGYLRDVINEFEGKPQEVVETVGVESKELQRYKAKMEERERQEEELFTRVPLTRIEKKKEKHLKKSRNGLLGLTENFYDEIRSLPLGDNGGEQTTGFHNVSNRVGKLKKRKRRH